MFTYVYIWFSFTYVNWGHPTHSLEKTVDCFFLNYYLEFRFALPATARPTATVGWHPLTTEDTEDWWEKLQNMVNIL